MQQLETREGSFARRPAACSAAAILAAVAAFGQPALAAPLIPICPGFTVVTAISESDGDYESIKTIESIGDGEMRIRYSSERMDFDFLSNEPPTLKRTLVHRTVLYRTLNLRGGKTQWQVTSNNSIGMKRFYLVVFFGIQIDGNFQQLP